MYEDPNWEYIVSLSMPSPLGALVCAAGESRVCMIYIHLKLLNRLLKHTQFAQESG